MESIKTGTDKKSPDGLSHPNQKYNIKHIMVIFHKKWKEYGEIQLTKNKMDLNNLIMNNHPPSPVNIN